jgi:hypothetical protein
MTIGGMLAASPGGLSSAHTPGTLKGISGPFQAVFTECNLHSSSWGVMRTKALGGSESKLTAACPFS